MTDIFSKAKRSEIMSRIRSKNTEIELTLRRMLWREGFRYKIHYNKLPGKPDIAFVSNKVAVFVDSHFWHGYDWKNLKKKLKSKYWKWKIAYNIDRDKKINAQLRKMGWKVVRLWEHEIKKNPEKCIRKIKNALQT